jgi:hypothetical protein
LLVGQRKFALPLVLHHLRQTPHQQIDKTANLQTHQACKKRPKPSISSDQIHHHILTSPNTWPEDGNDTDKCEGFSMEKTFMKSV